MWQRDGKDSLSSTAVLVLLACESETRMLELSANLLISDPEYFQNKRYRGLRFLTMQPGDLLEYVHLSLLPCKELET
jgi:hypothetical protein